MGFWPSKIKVNKQKVKQHWKKILFNASGLKNLFHIFQADNIFWASWNLSD